MWISNVDLPVKKIPVRNGPLAHCAYAAWFKQVPMDVSILARKRLLGEIEFGMPITARKGAR